MELKELRYFKSIAELSSFSRAASLLRIAQPALSRQVHKLEADLGVELFVRHGRGVTLTPAGTLLLEKVETILRQLRQTREEVVSCASTPTGHLRFGVPPGGGGSLVPPLLQLYRMICPGVTVNVVEGFTGFLYEWLASGRVDVAVLNNPASAPDLIIEPILLEDMYLVSSGSKQVPPLRESYTLREVAELPLILPSFPHTRRQIVATAMAHAGLVLKPALEVDGPAVMKALVQKGFGHTILTFGSVAEDVARGDLVTAQITDPGIRWNLCVAMRKELQHNQAAQQLRLLIREQIVTLVEAGMWRGTLLGEASSLAAATLDRNDAAETAESKKKNGKAK